MSYPYSSLALTPVFSWLSCGPLSVSVHLSPMCIIFLFRFSLLIVIPFDGLTPPHTLHPGRTSSLILPLPQKPAVGWLLCIPIKCQPLKANAPFPLHFLTCVLSHPSNKPTNGGAPKPDSKCLAWDHMERWCYVLRPPLSYLWRGRTKPLESREAVAHFVAVCFCVLCFVFCVLCFVFCVLCFVFCVRAALW